MLRRDAAMARDLASREVGENVENVSSEQLKLKMTNRELYEERENVAQYIIEAPSEVANVVQKQLSAAMT